MQDGKKLILEALKTLRQKITNGPERHFPNGVGQTRRVAGGLLEDVNIDAITTMDGRQPLFDGTIPRVIKAEIDGVVLDLMVMDALPAPRSILRRLDAIIEDLGGKPTDVPLFDPKTGTLLLNGKLLKLTSSEKYVLAVLVEKGTASLTDLQAAHGRPDKVLKALREKYPKIKPLIALPGGPAKGGYSTTIRQAHAD